MTQLLYVLIFGTVIYAPCIFTKIRANDFAFGALCRFLTFARQINLIAIGRPHRLSRPSFLKSALPRPPIPTPTTLPYRSTPKAWAGSVLTRPTLSSYHRGSIFGAAGAGASHTPLTHTEHPRRFPIAKLNPSRLFSASFANL